jgi:NAD(P)-dependent dehydrogenase (short-subunit alcohol dehydrogenase family)
MDLGLAGRVALVTGASSGIGFATCRALAREGMRVVGVARREIRGLGDAVASVQLDLAEPGGPAAAVDETARRHGRLDVLVNKCRRRHDPPRVPGHP